MIAMIDASLVTKFTVQFNLFGGTLMALHTQRHLSFMREVDSLKHMGCFCFTELGFGNNAPKMETTATYDKATDEFIIHSPMTLSQKFWITNGACHANYGIVFAQTIVGGKNEGVNGFIVRIRDDAMKPCKGVFIEDMGIKLGLNGIDNGRLTFDHVRIPRTAMLNSFSDVNEKGEFTSEVQKSSARFFKVADRLMSGRLCISAMSLAAIKMSLFFTIRYSQQRLAIGVSGESDTPIMSY
jgi:acyl-CoA oxidase